MPMASCTEGSVGRVLGSFMVSWDGWGGGWRFWVCICACWIACAWACSLKVSCWNRARQDAAAVSWCISSDDALTCEREHIKRGAIYEKEVNDGEPLRG